jgi:hypothetical protein
VFTETHELNETGFNEIGLGVRMAYGAASTLVGAYSLIGSQERRSIGFFHVVAQLATSSCFVLV